MTICACPNCKQKIDRSELSRVFWEIVSDLQGDTFDIECPFCAHSISIVVTSIPEFSIIPSLQPAAPEKKSC